MSKEIIAYYPYSLVKSIVVNDWLIKRVDISSHCDKHLKHGITHELIIELVKLLDKGDFEVDGQEENKLYFKNYYYDLENENYKLVWWWWLDKNDYILRVRTCHPI